MAEQTNDNGQNSKKRGLKGLHRIPLKKAIELANAVFELGSDMPVPRGLALDHIGRAVKGGSSDTLVGASNAYGLTKSVDEKLQLTELGKTVVDPAVNEATRRKSIYDALFASEYFSSLVLRYADKAPPNDRAVQLYLTQSLELSESDADVFWKVTKQNLDDYGLTKELSAGGRMIISRERAESSLMPIATPVPNIPKVDDEDSDEQPSHSDEKPTLPKNIELPAKMNPEFHFNIQIHLPADASADQYDLIFKSIAVHLLGRNADDK